MCAAAYLVDDVEAAVHVVGDAAYAVTAADAPPIGVVDVLCKDDVVLDDLLQSVSRVVSVVPRVDAVVSGEQVAVVVPREAHPIN
jgi:hypothetical protein